MTEIIAITLTSVFLLLASIHIYWSFGGKWGITAALPTNQDNQLAFKEPGVLMTLMVALGLMAFAVLVLIRSGFIDLSLPVWLRNSGLWIIAGIFCLRAIGEFNYVWFLQEKRQTLFAVNDTRYYSPLCLFIGILSLILERYV